jgi:NAD(P)-dependent dehydrogenase (short-subunit alcohol dehydrogenase family)
MKIEFHDKRALVTASTSGIGFAIAQGLAEAGAEVVVNGRSEGSVNDAVAKLSEAVPGATISGVAADLGSSTGVEVLVRKAGQIDILVNNAGIYGTQDFFETDDDVWDNYWQTNVMSGVRLSRALLPAMVEKN